MRESNERDVVESELILAAQSGDAAAFSSLVKQYSRRVYRLAYSFVHNVDDAADIVQEVFIRAFRNLSRFDTTRALYPWLHRITRNLCINLRSRKANTETTLPTEEILPAVSADPLAVALENERLVTIRQAIDELPAMHREIIVLKHYQECSYAEMAEILDIPIGTIMSRLYNARQKLKVLLEEVEA